MTFRGYFSFCRMQQDCLFLGCKQTFRASPLQNVLWQIFHWYSFCCAKGGVSLNTLSQLILGFCLSPTCINVANTCTVTESLPHKTATMQSKDFALLMKKDRFTAVVPLFLDMCVRLVI